MRRLWIFADWKLPDRCDLEMVEEMGFTDVVLGMGVNDNGCFKTKYGKQRVVNSAEQVKALGPRVHVMSWIRRQKTFIRECGEWMVDICEATDAASGMLDAEGDWHRNSGVSAAEGAALVQEVFDGLSCSLGVTGLSKLHSTVRPLLDVCDYGLGQAYSIWKPGSKEHWSHSKATEPGAQQAASWASWGVADKPLVMGLSNYWANRPARFGMPAMGVRESLEKALEGARLVGADHVAYWSVKWLHGTSESRQIAREVIKAIPIEETVEEEAAKVANQPAAVQWLLVRLGYDLGAYGPDGDGVDGFWGEMSQAALDAFRRDKSIERTGVFVLEDVTDLVNAVRDL